MDQQKHISIRINEAMLKKFRYIVKHNDSSASGQIMLFINQSIRDFEKNTAK